MLFHWNPQNCRMFLWLKQLNLLNSRSWCFTSDFIPLVSWNVLETFCLHNESLLYTDCKIFHGSFSKMYAGFRWTILKGSGEKYPQTSCSFENLGLLPMDFDRSECLGFLQSHWKMQHYYSEWLAIEYSVGWSILFFLSYLCLCDETSLV